MKTQKSIKYPKTYREHIGRMLGCSWYLVMGGLSLFVECYSIYMIILYPDRIFAYFMVIGVLVWFIGMQRTHLGERFASKITFFEDRVVWRCFGYIPVIMKYDEMEHVGIETFDDLDRGMVDIRGDGTAYIYMSVEPYPEKYKRKIIQLRTKKGFIKFKYTDGVAEALMDRLPVEKVEQVRGFYFKMKYLDSQNELFIKQEKRKRARRKKQEQRKREKESRKTK